MLPPAPLPAPLRRVVPTRAPAPRSALAFALGAVLAAACGGGGSGGVVDPKGAAASQEPVSVVEFGRPSDTLDVGALRPVTVTLRDARGAALAGRPVVWTSSDTSVVRADTAGGAGASAVARGVGLGSATLTAASGGRSAQLAVTVRASAVARVELPRAADTLVAGTRRALTAALRDARGLTLDGRAVVWTSSDTAVVRADTGATSTQTAGVVAVAAGTAVVTAASNGQRAAVVLTVRPAATPTPAAPAPAAPSATPSPVRALQIDTRPRAVRVGDTLTIAAVPLDAAGRPVSGRAVSFTTAAGSTGRVSTEQLATPPGASLRITALAPGTVTIVAGSDNDVRATVPITIAGAPVAALGFGPRVVRLGVGRSVALPATATDAAGVPIPEADVAYATADPGVATVDAAGRVTMVAPGATTLTATADGRSATVALVALAPAARRGFHIDLRFQGSPDPSIVSAARAAAARWEAVIVASPGAYRVTLGAGGCGAGWPAMDETVTDVVIFVRLDNMDGPGNAGGNLVASAGPCVLRDTDGGSGAPAVGTMRLDAYDMLRPATPGATVDAMAHGIGHVLGIGTTWNLAGHRELVPASPGGGYVGAHAARAAYELGFTSGASVPVPVEDQGGGGTAGSHWRERALTTELMTGVMNFAPDALSQITVGSLADLGWAVDPAGADPFAAVAPLAGRAPTAARGPGAWRVAAVARSVNRPTEVLVRPSFVVRRTGQTARLPR